MGARSCLLRVMLDEVVLEVGPEDGGIRTCVMAGKGSFRGSGQGPAGKLERVPKPCVCGASVSGQRAEGKQGEKAVRGRAPEGSGLGPLAVGTICGVRCRNSLGGHCATARASGTDL